MIIYNLLLTVLALIALPLGIGIIALLIFGRRPQAGAQASGILIHAVGGKNTSGLSHISAGAWKAFADHLQAHHYQTLTIAQAADQAPLSGGTGRPTIIITFDDGFECIYQQALPVLQQHAMAATFFAVIDWIGKKSSWDVFGNRLHMSKSELQAVAAAGHEIGSHTLSHPDLTLLSPQALVRELADSKKTLEDLLGRPVRSLSFPFGQWNERVWRTAQECGYTAASVYAAGRCRVRPPLFAVQGFYAFDTVADLIEKCTAAYPFSNARSRGRIMPHFAKGAAMWKYRNDYAIFPKR